MGFTNHHYIDIGIARKIWPMIPERTTEVWIQYHYEEHPSEYTLLCDDTTITFTQYSLDWLKAKVLVELQVPSSHFETIGKISWAAHEVMELLVNIFDQKYQRMNRPRGTDAVEYDNWCINTMNETIDSFFGIFCVADIDVHIAENYFESPIRNWVDTVL